MADTLPTVKNSRKQSARRLIAVIAILVAANIAAWFFHAQADLTGDKRYTITDATRNMLKHLDRKIEVLVFLDGDDMPAAFQQLSNSTREMLRHFRDISDNKVTFRVIDPLGSDSTAINVLKQYRMQGIPVNISSGKKGMTQKMIFPWALATTPGDSGRIIGYPVFLQEVNSMIFNKKILLKSEMLLEYNLANGVHQLTRKERPAVAYLMGNGEQFDPHIGTALATLQQFYQVDTFNLGGEAAIPTRYKTILINRPTIPFNDQDKFKIDQYVMNGGNVFWSINMVTGTVDSLQNGHFNAMPLDLNLADLLFHYGVRINANMIEDAVSYAYIPVQSGPDAEATMLPWIYFPVLNAGSEHPVVKHLNGVLGRFVSSIDTNTNDPAIRKTPLLTSGKYARTEAAPLPVILQSAIEPPNPVAFPKANLMAAVLLEGSFSSAYAERRPIPVANLIDSLKLTVKTKAERPGKMIVTGDADMLANEYSDANGPADMGVYRFDRSIKYDNKSFLLNGMEYMNDDDNLLAARSKSFDTRILDPKLVARERGKWQFINIGIPLAAILIFGAVFSFVRKKKYAQ